MTKGYSSPLTFCDRYCAGANDCRIGGYECDDCGMWFCREDMHDAHLCDDCWNARIEDGEEEDE